MSRAVGISCALMMLWTLGCDGDSKTDATPDGGADTAIDYMCSGVPDHPEIYLTLPSTTVGKPRHAWVRTGVDYCMPLQFTLTSSNPAVATVPATATIELTTARAPFTITPVAPGTTTIRAQVRAAGGEMFESTVEFTVTDGQLPACAGSASGRLTPGSNVTVPAGSSLAGAKITLSEGASRDDHYHVDPVDVTIGCAPDQVPDGYIALGPAVTFGPTSMRVYREIPITLPIDLSRMPPNANLQHIEFTYTGPAVHEPRIVPFATPTFDATKRLLSIQTARLGTFQIVVKADAGGTRTRRFTFRGFTGFSMGAMGAGQIGSHHPELFDFVAPLGGPTDFAYQLRYFRDYNFGGFCTDAEREMDPTGCASGSLESRTPVNDQLYQHRQDFEHWYYRDGWEGQGGTFDRSAWFKIFRDLTRMYGNPNTEHSSDPNAPNILPPGVTDEFAAMQPWDRCANPIVIPPHEDGMPSTGFFDDEYNPIGAYPVITFCDGSELPTGPSSRDIGIWDPNGSNQVPVENFLAVDVNGNSRRDPGEPVLRGFHEPFDDVGLDGIASINEPGYDAVTNPDPNGDDFDFQFNPLGTERNWHRDGDNCTAGAVGVAEPFADFGLDGVFGTAQLSEGGYDFGEGDHCYSMAQGTRRMLESDARSNFEKMDANDLQRLDFWADSGIRDLLNTTPSMNNFMGAIAGRNRALRIVNGHEWIGYREPDPAFEFDFAKVDYATLGGTVYVRYGNPDATEAQLENGDGGHVGSLWQLISRLQSAVAWMSSRWPGGNRSRSTYNEHICRNDDPTCPTPNQILFNFTSSLGRQGPAAIILPPGYFDASNANERYPVIYMMHGYGMNPQSLIDTALFFWQYMTTQALPEYARLQRMIFVFPDGSCQASECNTGTFYTDGPDNISTSPKMETWLLELMDYVDENYRTRAPEELQETL